VGTIALEKGLGWTRGGGTFGIRGIWEHMANFIPVGQGVEKKIIPLGGTQRMCCPITSARTQTTSWGVTNTTKKSPLGEGGARRTPNVQG